MRIVVSILITLFTHTLLLAQGVSDMYLQHWKTDIPIWFNCGGIHSLIHYGFKGNAMIKQGKTEIKISNGRINSFNYSNISNSSNPHFEINGCTGYFSAFIEQEYVDSTICSKTTLFYGTGVRYDSNIKYSYKTNELFKKSFNKVNRKGKLIYINDSTICDTIPLSVHWGVTVDCFRYEVSQDHIFIKYRGCYGNHTLKMWYDKNGNLDKISNDGLEYTFRYNSTYRNNDGDYRHNIDLHGNWHHASIYDKNGFLIRTIERDIEYLDN